MTFTTLSGVIIRFVYTMVTMRSLQGGFLAGLSTYI